MFEYTAPDGGYVYQYSDSNYSDYANYGSNGGAEVQSIANPSWGGPYTSAYAWDNNSWTEADLVGVAPVAHTFYDHNVVVTPGGFHL